MSASTSLLSHRRGLAAEDRCVDWLIARGWSIVARRLKTPFAEIDLLVREPVGRSVILHAIEVKSLTREVFVLNRVGHKQRGRLLRARSYLEEHHSRLVELDLMIVDGAGDIQFFADFLS